MPASASIAGARGHTTSASQSTAWRPRPKTCAHAAPVLTGKAGDRRHPRLLHGWWIGTGPGLRPALCCARCRAGLARDRSGPDPRWWRHPAPDTPGGCRPGDGSADHRQPPERCRGLGHRPGHPGGQQHGRQPGRLAHGGAPTGQADRRQAANGHRLCQAGGARGHPTGLEGRARPGAGSVCTAGTDAGCERGRRCLPRQARPPSSPALDCLR